MYDSYTFLNLFLAILLIVLAVFHPYFTRRVPAWQKMEPRLRLQLTIGWQIFAILFAIQSLLVVLMDIEAITIATDRSISPWIQGLIVLALVFICVVTLLTRRKTKREEIEKTLEEKNESH